MVPRIDSFFALARLRAATIGCGMALMAVCGVQAQAPADPAPQVQASAPAGPFLSSDGQLELDSLLSDPVLTNDAWNMLRVQRGRLARQGGDPAAFLKLADDFERQGAYYSALELVWFAEKMTGDPARRKALNDRMMALIEKDKAIEPQVDQAVQFWAAGSPEKAIEQLRALTLSNPYAEKALYELGYRSLLGFMAHDEAAHGPLTLDFRSRVFRVCYESFLANIEIDPFFNDAYYQLSQARAVLSEHNEFLQRTEGLTRRALVFRSEVLPALEKIDNGDRTAETFLEAGDGLEGAGRYAYAVYAWQVARQLAPQGSDAATSAALKIDATLKANPEGYFGPAQ